MKSLLLVAALWAIPAFGLPDSPIPKMPLPESVFSISGYPKPVARGFWDSTNKKELMGLAVVSGFDMGQTCHNLATGGREYWLTQSCPKDVGIMLGFDAAAVGVAWILHKTGHHKLERLPMLGQSEEHVRGIVFSKIHRAW